MTLYRFYLLQVIWGTGLMFCINTAAGMIKCPVCGELFKDDVTVCPNDGTDLKILGKPVSDKDNSKSDTDKPSDKASLHSSKKAEDSDDNQGNSAADSNKKKRSRSKKDDKKYQRQDRGGSRKRVDYSESGPSGEGRRTERMKRIGDTRSFGSGDAQGDRRKKAEERARKDAEIRAQYAKNIEEYRQEEARRQLKQRITGIERDKGSDSLIKGAPLVALGGRMAFMPEGESPGRLAGMEIDVNFLRGAVRLGLSGFAGGRRVGDRRDMIVNGSLTVGFQQVGRFAPFVLGRFGIGVLMQERFGEGVVDLLRNMGVEAGVDCRLRGGFAITPSVGFIQYAVNDVTWNSAALKLSVGF
jgi:hypothetical protein